MTTGFQPFTQVVEAKVLGVEDHRGKPMGKLDVPAWQSQYPVNLYNLNPEADNFLSNHRGHTVVVELKADSQKRDSDGSKPWMYFWSFVRDAEGESPQQGFGAPPANGAAPSNGSRPAPAGERTQGQPPAQGNQPTSAVFNPSNADRDRSIQRQVALKASIDYHNAAINLPQPEIATDDNIIATAQRFFDWLSENDPMSRERQKQAAETINAAIDRGDLPGAAETTAASAVMGSGMATNPRQQSGGGQPQGGRGGTCEVHGRPWGKAGSDNRIGHPIEGGGWCWQDEQQTQGIPSDPPQGQEPPDMDGGHIPYTWSEFADAVEDRGLAVKDVLGMDVEDFVRLGGDTTRAMARLSNYVSA